MGDVPEWLEWELELSPHLLRRMVDRQFNEADVRAMIEDHTKREPNHEPGRWVLRALHDAKNWRVIVEPDQNARKLVVVTAYPSE